MRKVFLLFAALFCSIILFAQSYVTTQDINFRKGAGASFETISVIPKGTTVEVLETSGSWSKVSYDGNYGYVSTKFLQGAKSNNFNGNGDNVQTKSASSSNLGTWIILSLVAALLIVFRKTLLVRFLFKSAGVMAKGAMNSSSKTATYRCRDCGRLQKVVGGGYPNTGTFCKTGRTHDWRQVE